ncbi:MAG: hypothetical protein JNL42_16335 [Anaerolineae bacterium]|nr:hypothetical protein [Anaerolineae bacterium]
MQPGLSRAIPMALLGFMVGSLVVIIIRGLQGLTPLWDTGVGMTLAAFTTAGFFVWGMGAFNPAMSAHGEEAEAAQQKAAADAPPRSLLIGITWQMVTALLVVIVILFGAATLPGGFTLTTTGVPEASLTQVGMVDMQIGGQTVQVSQLVVFAGTIIAMFVSLLVVAGALGWVFTRLAQGVAEAKAEAAGGAVISAPVSAEPLTPGRQIRDALIFSVLLIVLYLFFYYVAIGLILPQPDFPGLNLIFPSPQAQLVVLSVVNAFVIALLLMRPSLVLQVLGVVARFVARLLRRVPGVLQ